LNQYQRKRVQLTKVPFFSVMGRVGGQKVSRANK